MRPVAALVALALAAACAPLSTAGQGPETISAEEAGLDVPAALAERGVRRFLFTGWDGPDFPVWSFRPDSAGANAPVLFVHHGVRRDADRYIAEWLDLAQANGIVLVVPEFTNAAFPGVASYSHGHLVDESGRPRSPRLWSFAAIEPIFDEIARRERLSTSRYLMYGHSGGAQFVHRFILAGGGPRLSRAVSANAGSYAFPDERTSWPFGVGATPDGLWNPRIAFAQQLIVLLGTADTDPAHPSLPDQPEAVRQGPHRMARGLAFYDSAKRAAREAGVKLSWRCALVPDVGHDNAGMSPGALRLLRATGSPLPEGDCTALPAG